MYKEHYEKPLTLFDREGDDDPQNILDHFGKLL